MADPFSWITGISLIAGLIGSSGVLNGGGGGAPPPQAPAAPTQQQTAQKSLLGQ